MAISTGRCGYQKNYNMKRISKGFFAESEALKFEQDLFNFWPKGIDKRWFWLAFQALESSGLTYYESDSEEIAVRERLVLLAVLYYEYCHHSSSTGGEHFKCWTEEQLNQIRKDLSSDAFEELLIIQEALNVYFGSKEMVTDELWLNCMEGENNCLIPHHMVKIEPSEKNVFKSDGENWYKGVWNLSGLDSFEGMSI